MTETTTTSLRHAMAIIEAADLRAATADGPVLHVRDVMSDGEWRDLYRTLEAAAKGNLRMTEGDRFSIIRDGEEYDAYEVAWDANGAYLVGILDEDERQQRATTFADRTAKLEELRSALRVWANLRTLTEADITPEWGALVRAMAATDE